MDTTELLDFILQGLAPGIADCWDFQPNPADPDFYEEFYALAQCFKWAVKDRIDTLRKERNPATASEKLEDYELALGLLYTNAAQFGTVAQRQGQITGRLRESGGLSQGSVRSVMQSYLKYADPNQIQIIEPDRAALKSAHTYALILAPVTLSTSTTLSISLLDDSFVSDMGAQINLNVQVAGSGSSGIIQLRGPDGFVHEWALADYRAIGVLVGMNTVFDLVLFAQDFAPTLLDDGITFLRRPIAGNWKLTVKNMDRLNSASLFVEGIGRNPARQDGLGAALFEWAVVADGTKLGAGADLIGAADALQRMNHSHLRCSLETINLVTAIPDAPQTIPDQIVPG